ncbi:sulfatase [Acinetobacter puyangensis]|uniref:sulfatase n=1 Tax=Acinetobacter puyangensis TaxID=1096779 RepID=UPI003A4D9746
MNIISVEDDMKAIILMFDSLNKHMLPPYNKDTIIKAPNFTRLAKHTIVFDQFYAGSLPCMPARRELHTGRYNFLHRSWGPLEPFDDSMPQLLKEAGIHTHLASDHPHYWEDGGATYHSRYNTWEFFRGQEGDPWKGVVQHQTPFVNAYQQMFSQDEINRRYMSTEAEHSQTLTVDAGLHFIDVNVNADQWLLQIELFDPHEPFFTHPCFKNLYPHLYEEEECDWPPYQKVTESEEKINHVRYEYAALVSMCDKSLGRVLDKMDQYNLWKDTLLIVNTDHGFLLGEHGWWAKSVQPWFNELVNLPMFMWNPKNKQQGVRCNTLAQTIDIAPTILDYFNLDIPSDMQGLVLSPQTDASGEEKREGALFGIHGGHVNVTNGEYVYMRSAISADNQPLEEYTLMPTHMRSRFSVAELRGWQQVSPFKFTKSLSVMKIAVNHSFLNNSWRHGTLLFDLKNDPQQLQPIINQEIEFKMLKLLANCMHASEAPKSQFLRLGMPYHHAPVKINLLAEMTYQRTLEQLEPLYDMEEFQNSEVLHMPLQQLLLIHSFIVTKNSR